MESDRGSERSTADYGNLLLEVFPRAGEQEHVFGYIVTDKTDGLVCWTGSESELATAQGAAILEADLFLDPYATRTWAPQWRRNTLGAQV
jgi:hypothetical protein